MRKSLLILLIVSFFCKCVIAQADTGGKFHNAIDDITSKEQIEHLLKSIDPYFSTFHVNDSLKFQNGDCKRVSDSLHCAAWFKTDFDNNGYTDMTVVGGWD